MRRPRFVLFLVLVALASGALTACSGDEVDAGRDVPLGPYRGLGTWVDVFDYVPGFQSDGGPPPVTAASVDDMAALGVETLYLQATQDDTRLVGDTVAPSLLGSFVRRAHANDMKVVAWYVPHFDDVDGDLRRIRALHEFRTGAQRFDGIAIDIEFREAVADPVARNEALLSISRGARRIVGDKKALGAIVLEPLLLEVVNQDFWPGFPWRRIAPYYDVWLPMSYWTNRTSGTELRDGFNYTDENIRRLRRRVGDPKAPVHAIGGIANDVITKDWEGFTTAARRRDAIGYSVYDFNTTTSGVWALLRRGRST